MNVFKIILISVGVIIFDLAIYLVLGMLLMNYDDFYDESEGEYWSLRFRVSGLQPFMRGH
jgi:hypothetical protein